MNGEAVIVIPIMVYVASLMFRSIQLTDGRNLPFGVVIVQTIFWPIFLLIWLIKIIVSVPRTIKMIITDNISYYSTTQPTNDYELDNEADEFLKEALAELDDEFPEIKR